MNVIWTDGPKSMPFYRIYLPIFRLLPVLCMLCLTCTDKVRQSLMKMTLLQVRVSELEKAKWQLWSDSEGVNSLSEWVRNRCNEEKPKLTVDEFLAKQREKYFGEQAKVAALEAKAKESLLSDEEKAELTRKEEAAKWAKFLPKCAVPAPETTEDSSVDDEIEEARRKELERLKAGPDEECSWGIRRE